MRIDAHIKGHGTFSAPAEFVDRAIDEYTALTADNLGALVAERTGTAYVDLRRSEYLIMIASFDADNPF